LVSLRLPAWGPVCLIKFPEQLSEPVRELTLWRKLTHQHFSQLGPNKSLIITLLPVVRIFVIRHAITLP
jgi:hypothetical protein